MEARELKNKTVFDFTHDETLLREVIGVSCTEAEYKATVHPVCATYDLMELGRMIKDKELYEAARELYQKHLKNVGGVKDGMLID